MSCQRFVLLVSIWLSFISPVSAQQKLLITMTRGATFSKLSDGSVFRLKSGETLFSDTLTLLTLDDGQTFFKTPDNTEIRMKQDSVVLVRSGCCEVRKGCIGIRRDDATELRIVTPHFEIALNRGTLVIKSTQALTRATVVKGEAFIINPHQTARLLISAGEEIAAGNGMFSRLYKQTAELRYTWYWVDALKEPALTLEPQ